MSSESTDFVHAVSLDDLREDGRTLVNRDGQAIALFYHEGEVRAVDNRCPHMGFPLTEGTVDDGVLTCHWHHARFELSCGDTFDPWADDVPTYPVEVRDGDVWVRPEPRREKPPGEHWRDRLRVGLEENLRLVVAKAVIGLDDAGADAAETLATAVDFGTRYDESGWGRGLTTLAALANLLPYLDPEDRRRAMYVGVSEVASDCAGQPPRFEQPAFRNRDVPKDRLKEWFRENVEVRDADGAERTLRTAVEALDAPDVADLLLAAATDHLYLDSGHRLDFANKAFETLERAGWDHADQVVPSLAPGLAGASRAEEGSEWRQPVDVAGMIFDAHDDFAELAAADGERTHGEWTEPEGFVGALLDDDPSAVVDAITGAAADGATPADLAETVTYAAALRVAQFSTTNEFSDWNTVHHTYTYANAVHGMTLRTDAWEGYRGVLDAAANVYLDRFLNMPAADVPDGDPGADPDAALDRLTDTFDREGAVDEAGRAVADYLAAGGDRDDLVATLGGALVREDAGFHTIQNVEVGVEQAARTDDPDRRRVFLVAAARYLGAHTPTRREREQTFRIAQRLERGERIHDQEASTDDADAGGDADAEPAE